jgi:hypothetical protein
MTTVRRHGLQLDDPLAPIQAAARNKPAAESPEHTPPTAVHHGRVKPATSASPPTRPGTTSARLRPARGREPEPPNQTTADHEENRIWRVWNGVTGVPSFRLPHELLIELGDTARQLGLPIGMIVTAAITQLLDQPPETIAALVDRADDARIQGRRRSRRRLTTPSDD